RRGLSWQSNWQWKERKRQQPEGEDAWGQTGQYLLKPWYLWFISAPSMPLYLWPARALARDRYCLIFSRYGRPAWYSAISCCNALASGLCRSVSDSASWHTSIARLNCPAFAWAAASLRRMAGVLRPENSFASWASSSAFGPSRNAGSELVANIQARLFIAG